ncbi:hypothetical protein [Mycoplasma phocimorsus]|uniref:hypothetical protein n=1 Tax=Mycoplasma phocimorsus TaxID=3045839 RepID=UPI0024C03813|nr:hypothetical protein [Mycoplasma phocimorsus]MDJ1648921.1 hypothetical protein [Mycoplasma phocimorsus]
MKRKKIWMIPPNILFICSMTSLVACNNKVTYSQLKENFNKQKEKFHSLIKIENKKFSSGDPVYQAVNNSLSLLKKHEKTLENKKEINKKEYFTENESRLNNKDSELLQQLIKEEKQQKEELKKQKVITISLAISGSILAGVAAGLGIYFGTKDINSDENIKRRILESNFQNYKDFFDNSHTNNSLNDVLKKFLDLSFSKDIPKFIFVFLKETIFQEYLQDFDNESEKILLSELSKLETPSKEIFNSLILELNKLNIEKNETSKIIIKIKEIIISIINNYFPKLIKKILEFISLKSDTKEKSSILSRIIINILKRKNIIIKDIENISQVFEIIASILISDKNTLLEFFINKTSDILMKNELSFDIKSDFFNILNKTIKKIFANDQTYELSLEKIFDDIIPKIIELVQIDETKSYDSFVKFINNLFTFEEYNKKWVYIFMEHGNIESSSEVYLQNNIEKTYKIIFPKINFTLKNIFTTFKERKKITKTIDGIIQLLFKPLIIELSKSDNKESVKKSIFRLVIFLSFIFYKYTEIDNIFVNKFIHIVIDPENYLIGIINKLFNELNVDINISEILGSKHRNWWLIGKSFDIFKIIKNAAKNKNDSLKKMFDILKKGFGN